uniref:Uncharacterized protein n=1 Tax=Leersia perrieri TaxID=77586 RepID=A0A0D9VI36_9ORYZ
MDFTAKDGRRLWSLVRRQEALVDKKRRWLESMITGPDDGRTRRAKRPRYMTESDIRSEEDGLLLFNLQKGENGSLSTESIKTMHCTINKLSNEALQSVASIITHNKYSFEKTRPIMKKIIKEHLPNHLAKLDNEDIMSQLSKILRNPHSYQSDYVSLLTPVSPLLLSSINQALGELDGMPMQALVVINRKLTEKPCPPKFQFMTRMSTRGRLVKMVRKKFSNILTDIEEGHWLPKKLLKALSVINLYKKIKFRSLDISQSEFFPYPKRTILLQNEVLNALWSLPEIKHKKLKLLRDIFIQDSKVQKMTSKATLRRYLTECLFACDEADLPDEALQAVDFINQTSWCVLLTEDRKEVEVDAVLNLSSQLKTLAYYCAEECQVAEQIENLESEDYSEENYFLLSQTNYFQSNSQHEMDEHSCSNNIPNIADMDESCSSGTVKTIPYAPRAEDSYCRSEEVHKKPCVRSNDSGRTGYCRDDEAVGSKADVANHLKALVCSDNLSEICDETSKMAHMLIRQISEKWLLMKNGEVDELNRQYLGGGLVSQDSQGFPCTAERNLKDAILVHAVERLLPNLPKSCIDKMKRILR